VPFVSAEPAETNKGAEKSDGVPNGVAEKKPASSGSSSDGDSRPPSPKEVCHPADDLMVACMRRVRAQKGAAYHFEGKHAPAAKQTAHGLSRVPKKRPSRPARDASLPLSLGALGEKSREPVRTMPALPEPRVSDTSDISQWDLEPRGEAFREWEEDPTLAACAAAAAAAAAAARDRTGALSEEAWRGFLPDRHFLFKFDSMGPDPGPDAHDRDGLATVYDKTRSSPMDHLGSLAEDDADALDVMIARGVADGGNARLVSGNVGNGSGGRHEQLDELEDLVATVGLHKQSRACGVRWERSRGTRSRRWWSATGPIRARGRCEPTTESSSGPCSAGKFLKFFVRRRWPRRPVHVRVHASMPPAWKGGREGGRVG
jgi:hypothetical protein